MVKALGIDSQPVPSTASFKDVKPSDWYYKPVEIMRQNNYISGYADGFRPHQFIPKAEMITIVSRALSGPALDEQSISEQLAKFKDGSLVPGYARLGIAEAAKADVLVNYPDASTINATQLATRAETAAVMFKLNDYLTQQQINQGMKNASSAPVAAAPANNA